jgi:hypothetical protein
VVYTSSPVSWTLPVSSRERGVKEWCWARTKSGLASRLKGTQCSDATSDHGIYGKVGYRAK